MANATMEQKAQQQEQEKQEAAKQAEAARQEEQNIAEQKGDLSPQEQAEKDKVDREREIMRDPHEKEATADKKKANGPHPMPTYRDHDHPGKTVSALRIKEIREVSNAPTKSELHFVEAGFGPVKVDAPWVTAHMPRAGGWYVVDADGRRFLNAQDFEHRYRRGATT